MSFCLRIFNRRHRNSRTENDIHRVQQPQARSQLERMPLQYTRSLDSEPKNEASLVRPPKRQGRDMMVDGDPGSHRNDPGCEHKAGEHQIGSELGGLINENHGQHGLTPGNSSPLQDQSGRHGRDLHLLALEGRGVYSLATLIILKEVLQQYQYLQKLTQLPRPCDVFDLAGGTDSGGIIVILLFRLGMGVDEAITVYTRLLEDVFSQKTVMRSNKETRTSLLVKAIAMVIGSSHVGKNQAQELRLLDDNGPKCFVSTSTSGNLPSTLFRTYITPRHANNSDNYTIVDAIKAMTAEEPFFLSIDEKVDGPLNHGASRIINPLKSVLEEAVSIFPGQFISCMLSIGSGARSTASLETSTGELPRKVVDDSGLTDEVAKELLNKGVFHCRLNVDDAFGDSSSGGWEGLGEIGMHTQNYLELSDVNEKVSRLVQVLNKRTAIASTVEETLPLLDELFTPNTCLRETTEDNSDRQDNSDVQQLTPDHMSETLAYASRHWAMHLVNASEFDDETKQLLEYNVHKQLLAWQQSVPGVMKRMDPENSTPHRIKLYGSKMTTGVTPTTLLDGCRFIALNIEIFKTFPWHLLPGGPLNARSVSTFGEPEAGYKKARNPTGSILSFLTEHAEGVSFLKSSEDGMKLASASYGGTVRLWDGKAGDELAVLRGHSGSINSVAFSLDGTKLASASFDKTVRLWDSQTGSEIAVLSRHSGSVNSVAFSPIGTKLASASSDGTVRLWDGKTCAEVNVLLGHSDSVESVVFSPHGMKLASTSLDGTMRLWDGQSGAEITLIHSESIESVAFSPDGTKLALASYNGIVQLCDSQTGDEIARFAGSVFVGFTLDGVRLILMSAEEVYQVDCRSGDRLACKPLGLLVDSDVEAVRVSASDLWVIRVNQKLPSLQGLLVVKVDHNTVLHVMPLCWFPPNLPVTGFAVSSLSRVVVGCKDGRILLFDTHISSLSS